MYRHFAKVSGSKTTLNNIHKIPYYKIMQDYEYVVLLKKSVDVLRAKGTIESTVSHGKVEVKSSREIPAKTLG